MSIDHNDPKWTAYVLGELSDAQRSAVDELLARSPDATRLVDDIRRTAGMLTAALADDVPAVHQASPVVASRAADGATSRAWLIGLASFAACVLVAGGVLLSGFGPNRSESLVAKKEADRDDLMRIGIRHKHYSNSGDKLAASTSPATSNDTSEGLVPSRGVVVLSDGRREIAYSVTKPVDGKKNPPDVSYTVAKPVYENKARLSVRVLARSKDGTTLSTTYQKESELQLAEAARQPLGEVKPVQDLVTQLHSEQDSPLNTEDYDYVSDNPLMPVAQHPLSTFSIDVDTASYSNLRRFLTGSAGQAPQLPPRAAVRIEEMINYFRYEYPQPEGDVPFSVNTEVASCPWNAEHRLLRIGLAGREVPEAERPASNLVFLIDVSGSMDEPNKLPLVKASLRLLVERLREQDHVAIVVYAGSSGLALPSTSGYKKQAIIDAIESLSPDGSTNGAEGIQLAYEIARRSFQRGGVNRVILATDGDFNVGITDRGELVKLIEQEAKSGVFLTTLGFGMGNLKDDTLEQLADKGNGNYAYIDDLPEGRKVLVEQSGGTLHTIAKDVKIQVEFNPATVAAYRLIGYENRVLRNEDFNDDQKDAGEIGAGHTVTALYELIPAGKPVDTTPVDPLKYQTPSALTIQAASGELLTLKLRYKQPDGDKSQLIERGVRDEGGTWAKASGDFKFAAAVALFGMVLRESPYKGTASLDAVAELAREGLGADPGGYRAQLLELVDKAKPLRRP